MAAAIYDLRIEQGASFERQCQYLDSTGTPVNLTGMTIEAQIRRAYSDAEITKAFTITILDQSVPANLGKFVLYLSSSDTASIPVTQATDYETTPTPYAWDLEIDTGSRVRRLMQGAVYVSPEVTR